MVSVSIFKMHDIAWQFIHHLVENKKEKKNATI